MLPATSSPTHLTRGYLIALASSVVLSTTAILIRFITQTYQMPPLALAVWRDGITALALLAIFGLFRTGLARVGRVHLPYLAAYGLVLALFNSFWITAVALTGAAVATVLVYCSAGFTALLGWWLLKERLGWAKLLVVACSLGGCLLVAQALDAAAWQANLSGIVSGVLAGLGYAVYTLMGRSASQRGLNPWTTLFYTFAFATFFLLLFNLLPLSLPGAAQTPAELLWLGDALVGWGALFALAAGPTLLGFGLYNVSLTYLPSSVANLVVTSEPVFTALIAYVLLGERLTAIQMVGGLLILGGVVILRISEGR
ncbi:MAG: DMT family transporter [Anaerolineales bacterium]|nr:DMT family transporter [Anaerolineales bacterium]